jgi:hypothetical protein
MNETNRPKKQRMFAEYDHIEEAVKIAKITHEWVLLQKGEQTQLALLRDSLNRRAPSSISQPIPSFLPESSDVEFPDTSQRAEPALPTALSVPLQSIDSLSSVFFCDTVVLKHFTSPIVSEHRRGRFLFQLRFPQSRKTIQLIRPGGACCD